MMTLRHLVQRTITEAIDGILDVEAAGAEIAKKEIDVRIDAVVWDGMKGELVASPLHPMANASGSGTRVGFTVPLVIPKRGATTSTSGPASDS